MAGIDQVNDAKAVTPDDDTDLTPGPAMALHVGGAGNVAVTTANGSAVTILGVVAGAILPLAVTRVKATGTTATNITALY